MASHHPEETQAVNPLTEDGVNEEFFNLLWTKDELNFGPSVNIPDTIVFKFGQPTCWYFTSSTGRIKKKSRQNLLMARIEEAFNKYVLGYDVIATFVNMPVEKDPDTGLLPPSTIQFFDRQALNDFLFKSKTEANGILQRFIEPKGTKNEVVRAIWSPKVCLLERAENIHHLHDHRYGLYERCVTYEGPEYYSLSAPLRGPVLAGQIQKICESVVAHIAEVTFSQQQISRIVINFKVDSRDKIWLLYTTSIRVNEVNDFQRSVTEPVKRTLLNIDGVISLPPSVNLNPTRSYEKGGAIPKPRIRCISCANETLATLRHSITYKSVVKHYEHVLHLVSEVNVGPHKEVAVLNWPPDPEVIEAAGGVGFGCLQMVGDDDPLNKAARIEVAKSGGFDSSELRIPPILRYLHPKLTAKSYSRCRNDPLFLYKTVTICEACYLVYAEFTTMLLRLGQDLTKLLTPDPSATQLHDASSTLTRPSSADWRAMSSVNRSMSTDDLMGSGSKFKPNQHHKHAKSSAIGIRSSDLREQPDMPKVIRKFDDANLSQIGGGLRTQMSIDSFGTAPQLKAHNSLTQAMEGGLYGGPQSTSIEGGVGGGGSSGKGPVDFNEEESIQHMIAEREAHFFKEISKNPQLRNQHPLMHLINAQEKLKMIDEQSGVLVSKATSTKEGLYSSKYGKQTNDKFDRYHVYEVDQPYRMDGKLIAPAKWHKMKRLEKLERAMKKRAREERKRKRQEAMTAQLEKEKEDKEFLDSQNPDLHGDTSIFTDDSALLGNSSAKKHASFLRDTMMSIQAEVDKSVPLLETMQFIKEEEKQPKSTTLSRKSFKAITTEEASKELSATTSDVVGGEAQHKAGSAAGSTSKAVASAAAAAVTSAAGAAGAAGASKVDESTGKTTATSSSSSSSTSKKEVSSKKEKERKEKEMKEKEGEMDKKEKSVATAATTAPTTTNTTTTGSSRPTSTAATRVNTAQESSRPGTTNKVSRQGSRSALSSDQINSRKAGGGGGGGSPTKSQQQQQLQDRRMSGNAEDDEDALLRQWGIHPSNGDNDDDASVGLGFHDEMGSSSLDEAADLLRSLMSAGNDAGEEDPILNYTPTPSIITDDSGHGFANKHHKVGGVNASGDKAGDVIMYTPAPSMFSSEFDMSMMSLDNTLDNSDSMSVNSYNSLGSRESTKASSRAHSRAQARSIANEALKDSLKFASR